MQIVEATDLWIRVAELQFRHPVTPLRFTLYPMLHVGDPSFYEEVTRRLQWADVVVTEGVGPSRAGRGLTAGYRAMAEDEQLRLMVQYIDYDSLPGQVICPDSSGEEFDTRWRTVPRWQRAALTGLIGGVAAGQRLFGSAWLQRMLAETSLDDLPDNEEVLAPELLPDIERVVLDERDERLVAALDELHAGRAAEPVTVGVVYGAAHMRAAAHGLIRHGYRVRTGDWLTVMVIG